MVSGVTGSGGAREPGKPTKPVGDRRISDAAERVFNVGINPEEDLTSELDRPQPRASKEPLEKRSRIVQEALGTLDETATAVRTADLPADVRAPAEGFLISARHFLDLVVGGMAGVAGAAADAIWAVVDLQMVLIGVACDRLQGLCRSAATTIERSGLAPAIAMYRSLDTCLQEGAKRLAGASTHESLLVNIEVAYKMAKIETPDT